MSQKKILVIEDDVDMIKLISLRLRSAGYTVVSSFDALQGIKFAHDTKPDLIVLDLMMPAGGGLWLLEKIKENSVTYNIPVIVYTALKDDITRKKAMEKGADLYFDKTADSNELVIAIKNLLKEKDKGE